MKTNKSVAVVLAAAILASGGGIASSVLTAPPAQAASAVSTQPEIDAAVAKILADTNAARKAAGLAPLTLAPGLTAVAQNWTQTMAATGYGHNPKFASQLPRGLDGATAENVAMGLDAATVVNEGWMKSTAGHRENLLGNYTHIGIGYYKDANGMTWFTQNFSRYNLNLSVPYVSTDTPQAREFTSGWYERPQESVNDYTVSLYSAAGVLLETKTIAANPADSRSYLRATFTGLTPKTTYTVKSTARNTTVMGTTIVSPTRTYQVTTLPEYAAPSAPNAPTSLVTTNNFYNQSTVSWKAPVGVVGTITDYNVTLKEAGEADRVFNTSGTTFNLTGLTANTDYTVEVTANVLGEDQKTRIVSPAGSVVLKTPAFYPVSVDAPTNIGVSAVSHDSATVAWKAPVGTVGNIVNYTVSVSTTAGTKTFTTAATSYRITGLTANAGYSVLVQANAVSVDGLNKATSMGAATIFTTTSSAPSVSPAPTPVLSPIVKVAAPAVTIGGIGPDRASVSWVAPAVTGYITGYRVTVKQGTVVKQTFTVPAIHGGKQIIGLAENTTYTILVDAMATSSNGVNKATATTTKTVKTGFTAASTVKVAAPASFATSVTRNTVNTSWRMPAVTGKVVSYTVTLKEGTRVVKTAVTGAGKYSFTGLKANTAYTVTVTANAVSANGKYKAAASVSKVVRTLR